ncbi:MAG: hypothetical protein IRZ29_06075, partial [Thermoflavifilum sp.]|nr:hypothetical protein [Thermoflavifilum sp.]
MKGKSIFFIPLLLMGILCLWLWSAKRQAQRNGQQSEQRLHELLIQYRQLQQENEQLRDAINQLNQQRPTWQSQGTMMDLRAYYRKNWPNYIHISIAKFQTGLFGGIHQPTIRIDNQTDFPIDQVELELAYIQNNGQVFQTIPLTASNIRAHSTETLVAPDSRRGVKINLKLQSITSQEMNFCWTAAKAQIPPQADACQCAPA